MSLQVNIACERSLLAETQVRILSTLITLITIICVRKNWRLETTNTGKLFLSLQIFFNPLPTNDAPMRHDISELSISLWEFIWGI